MMTSSMTPHRHDWVCRVFLGGVGLLAYLLCLVVFVGVSGRTHTPNLEQMTRSRGRSKARARRRDRSKDGSKSRNRND